MYISLPLPPGGLVNCTAQKYISDALHTLTFTCFSLFILSLVEGSEEEKMETDSDGQQLEKVKAIQMSPHRETIQCLSSILVFRCCDMLSRPQGLPVDRMIYIDSSLQFRPILVHLFGTLLKHSWE